MPRTPRLMLASIGRPYSRAVLDETVRIAREQDAKVSVLQLVRVWGSGLGLPHPGLRPNRREQQRANDTLNDALAYLKKRNITISGQIIIPTRHPAKAILAHARRVGVDTIVIEAGPKPRLGIDLSWGGEPRRIARKFERDVVLIPPPPVKV